MQIDLLIRRRWAVLAVCVVAGAIALLAGGAHASRAGARSRPAVPDFVPGKLVVGFRAAAATPALEADVASRSGDRVEASTDPGVALVDVGPHETLTTAEARLRASPDVAYAVPDYIAHTAGYWIPNDAGGTRRAAGWQSLQWNFLAREGGVGAPVAWANLRHDLAPGGAGVTVAILDTGVAYRNWTDPSNHERFVRSPDFAGTHFAAPCDLIRGGLTHLVGGQIVATTRCTDPDAVDRNGHGTFVAGVVGETTNNHLGVTGLAYGATIMPVRVLDAAGDGDSVTIARGIRYAATHGARVINLSLEFDLSVDASDIPDVINAIRYAYRHGVIVVAAAGNDSAEQLAYPAADSQVISVGATTRDRCVASYSNTGPGLDMVAPGGGDDAALADHDCHPSWALPDVFQMTLVDAAHPSQFGLPDGWYGTSMAAPHVAAAAALVLASGVLGAHPSPGQVLARLLVTATPLGTGRPNYQYGFGMLNAAAATSGFSQTARSRRHHPKPKKH